MDPIKIVETSPGNFSLLLIAGTTDVDGVIEELGHEPNGYFWEGVAGWVVQTEAPALTDRFKYDPEGGMFVAYGTDRPALEELSVRLTAVASDADRARQLVAAAKESGFEFDD
ncbi:immunity 51 family protein [Actinoplanes sp. TRM 88003]|uniref:Immunity 51 family protein n=1 Tax=Paractinoplanes aksuensis TaxID=2939490 RepID=A0ABT1DFJ3_9ACTN|nr:Imm51 family immunity protein [Actinoplanes aksuensis]MCO8269582.1 immunity 51 family protein [Actinoplanes aksuensis]